MMIVEQDEHDSYNIFTVGQGTHDFPLSPFKTNIKDFINFDIHKIRTNMYTKNHNGKHILFAGCSVTHGVGIEDEMDIWSSIVFNEITKKEKVSGFYSVAYPGHSITLQVSLIMRYISQYGKPDVIFFNLPSTARTFMAHEDAIYLSQVTKHQEANYPGSIMLANHTNFESYLFLHEFCKATDTRLISFTWSDLPTDSDPAPALDLFKDKFDSFHISKVKVEDYLEDYMMNHTGKNLLLGTDGQHPGIALHSYYASIALDAYYE